MGFGLGAARSGAISLFCLLLALPATSHAALKDDILALTGGRRVKMVWTKDHSTAGNNFHGSGNEQTLEGFDTATGSFRVILSTQANYSKPHITHDGARIVYTDNLAKKIHVINWDGTGNRIVKDGFAGTVWYDSASQKEWVYYAASASDVASEAGPLMRVNLDNASETQQVWGSITGSVKWLSISSDGARFAACFPWNKCGVAVPNYGGSGGGTLYYSAEGYYSNGCWPTITPDTSYRAGVFDGPHRNWIMRDTPNGASRTLDLHQGPGIDGWEIYHPKMSNNPRFMTLTGPYSNGTMGNNNIGKGGHQIEVYFGQINEPFTQLDQWIQVTNDSVADFWPTAWVADTSPSDVQIEAFSVSPLVIAAGQSATLSWSTANATAAAIAPSVGSVDPSGTAQVSPTATTTYTLTAEGPNGPKTRSVTVVVGPSAPVHLRINCGDGSPAVTDWADEDAYRTGGSAYDFSGTVDLNGQTDPAPADLYTTCIHLDHSYDFPLPDGTYVVRLHFYDQYGGDRRMDYTMEGTKVLNDFDIAGTAGGAGRVWIEEVVVAVTDGNGLQIVAEKDGGNDAFESGIEILTYDDEDTSPPTISIDSPANNAVAVHPLTVGGTAADDVGLAQVEVWLDDAAPQVATGTSSWTATLAIDNIPNGTHTVYARASDLAGNTTLDQISIVTEGAPELEILAPMAGAKWEAGSEQVIRWTTSLDNVTIFYTLDGDVYESVVQTIFVDDPDWGALPWTVPEQPTTKARIMVQGYFGEVPTFSDEFSIVAPGSVESPPLQAGCAATGAGGFVGSLFVALLLFGWRRRSLGSRRELGSHHDRHP